MATRNRKLALVTGHFPPSNLAGTHRARLWSQYLPEFGWDATIVTPHWRYYEETLDWDLAELVPATVPVVRTSALPTRPLRLFGEIGLRSWPWVYRALAQLAPTLDFVLVTIPSNFLAPLGRMLWRRFGVPYGVDFQDPWVHPWPGVERPLSKAWISYRLAQALEPWSVKEAHLITSVAPAYLDGLLERHPGLCDTAVIASMQIGGNEPDFDRVRALSRLPTLFDSNDGCFHLVYAGALLPASIPVLERLLAALAILKETTPELSRRLRLHFIGTGTSPDDPSGFNVLPHAERWQVTDCIQEHPQRMPYTDVLTHLSHASAVLIIGSTEPHYSPSKLFQAVLARRPVLALLHEKSSAVEMARAAGTVRAITFTAAELPEPERLVRALRELMELPAPEEPDLTAFERYSARSSARALAAAVDQALARIPDRRR